MSPVTRLNLFAFLRTGLGILKVYAGLPLLRVIPHTYMSVWIVFDKGQITAVVILSKGNVNSSCAVNPTVVFQASLFFLTQPALPAFPRFWGSR